VPRLQEFASKTVIPEIIQITVFFYDSGAIWNIEYRATVI